MSSLTPAELTIRVGGVVGKGIEPFLAANAPTEGEIQSWLVAIDTADQQAGRAPRDRDIADVRLRLQILERFWKHFRIPTSPSQTRWAKVLLSTLNSAAHVPGNVTAYDFIAFLGIAINLLRSVDADSRIIAQLERLRQSTMRVPATEPRPSTTRATADREQAEPAASTVKPAEVPMEPATVRATEVGHEATAPAVGDADQRSVTSRGPKDEVEEVALEAEAEAESAVIVDLVEPPSDETDDVVPTVNLRNRGSVEELRERFDVTLDRFGGRVKGSSWGLETEFITVGSLRLMLFYRSDVNFALVHNRVSILAGVGVHFTDSTTAPSQHRIESFSIRLESLDQDGAYRWVAPDLELAAGEEWWAGPTQLQWNLPPDSFIDLDEARADALIVELTVDGEPVRRSIPLRVLAHDQWTPSTVPEIIAAFVRPRSEAVHKVLSAASDLLAERTGSPSLLGYQDSPERVHITVRAIYDAIRALEIRYSEPPASFEKSGQKIRTSEVVLREQFGTCLDLTVLFAAVLEEAGIQPFVVLLREHSIVGYTAAEVVLDPAFTDPGTIDNLLGGGLFVPIETTAATAGKDVDFDDAVAYAESALESRRKIRLVVDVRAAHRKMQPLPTIVDKDGNRAIVIVEDRKTRNRKVVGSSAPAHDETRALMVGGYPLRVDRWRTDLLDLTFRNPLLKLADSRALRVLLPGDELGTFEDRLAANETIRLTPHEQVDELDRERGITSAEQYDSATQTRLFEEENRTYVSAGRASTLNKLTKIRRDGRSLREETGASALYVSLGLLRWKSTGKDGKEQEGRSPLFLLPIELTGSHTRPYAMKMEANADIKPNVCLIEKLKQEFDLTLPQLENPPVDDSGIDLVRVFQELRQTFLEKGLDFSIEAQAHIGLFQFASLDMWRDVSENWESLSSNPVVDHLIHRPGDLFEDAEESPVVVAADEVDVMLPLPADGSQLAAVKAATSGRTFVLEGPPGTGKSQTITNMIADGLAHGRTILFVAEKQAALSVVRDRLARIGLEPLILDVHGKDQSLNTVRQQLKKSEQAVRKGNPVAFNTTRKRLRHTIEDLEVYPRILHESASSESIWDSYQRCLAVESSYPTGDGWRPEDITVTPELRSVDAEVVRRTVMEARASAQRAQGARLPHAWAFIGGHVVDSETDSDMDAATLIAAAASVADAAARIPAPLARLWDESSPDQRDAISTWMVGFAHDSVLLPSELDEPYPSVPDVERMRADLESFRRRWAQFAEILQPAAIDADVQGLQHEYEEAQRAGLLKRGRLTKLALRKIGAYVRVANEPDIERDPLRFLTDLGAFQSEYAALRLALTATLPATSSLHLLSPETVSVIEAAHRDAGTRAELVLATRQFLAAAPDAGPVLDALVRTNPHAGKSGELSDSLAVFEAKWEALAALAGADEASLTSWLDGAALIARVQECAPEWGSLLLDDDAQIEFGRVLQLHRALHDLRTIGLAQPADQIRDGGTTAHLAEATELAVNREKLRRQLRAQDLDVFDPRERASRVDDYVAASRDMKRQSWSELPAALLRKRKKAKAIGVGLRKELERKRGGSIRTLFEHYGDEILRLTPVVLMSPAAVARFLPVGKVQFDTVIFDEASQVRVADAVGALGRARSAVIVGDSKQMPPTNIFAAGANIDEEELVAVPDAELPEESDGSALPLAAWDQESILSEAVSSGLEQKWLSWHYRSRHESLISFSNVKYYDGNLQVFPGPPEAERRLGVSSRFVDGVFDRGRSRTNVIEARAIVADITERLQRDKQASIGVVTFNTQQRDLILDLLEQSESSAVRNSLDRADEPVFVKNLENVQGDERDVILFSLAFSKDPETGTLRHNFGPMNNAGGERRLNVAITRARDAVVLFTSIRSTDIDPERTSAEGVLHLREYLAYAERGSWDGIATDYDFAAEDLYREEVASRLRADGLEVVTDVGTSRFRIDLAVRYSPDRGWLAVMLDTPEWAGRTTTADRDSLPGEILEGVMGWQETVQLLLPAWLKSKDEVVVELIKRAEALTLEPEPAAPSTSIAPAPITETHEVDGSSVSAVNSDTDHFEAESIDPATPAVIDDGRDPLAPIRANAVIERPADPVTVDRTGEYPYVEASTEIAGRPQIFDNLRSRRNSDRVRRVIDETIEAEGPIEADRLARLVNARFGVNRTTRQRNNQILALAPRAPERDREFGDFYWPQAVDSTAYTGYRTREGGIGLMKATEVSHVEIKNAALGVLRNEGSLGRDSLIRELMGVFGWARLGTQIRDRLDGVINRMLTEGQLVSRGGELHLR